MFRKPPRQPALLAGKSTAWTLHRLVSSISVPHWSASSLKQYRAYLGPALLVSVGYMDPGNWGTDLQAGAMYQYGLLWVVALASAMAIVLQMLAAQLGIVTGKNLAEACHAWYPSWSRLPLWILCEIAIAACDLAEVLGSAVAINLLFGVPLFWAVIMTAADVFLLLLLQHHGMRTIERVVLVLVLTIAGSFFIELFVLPGTRPDFGQIGTALVHPTLATAGMASVAVGIIGATVMPHNLYLHSSLVQSRETHDDVASKKIALRCNAVDTVVSLSLAFLVNAGILILAAVVFHGRSALIVDGHRYVLNDDTDWIRVAYLTFAPAIGSAVASVIFAVALLASGQSSTITGTIAGQVVMEGFMNWRIAPWKRRIITRLMAIIPAVLVIGLKGAGSINDLLVLSQVVLAMQLPFAMFPLLHFVSAKRFTSGWATPKVLLILGWITAIVITVFDVVGLPGSLQDAIHIMGS
ncbi:manganese transport protein [Sphingomonas trueperi]|uniref:Nramp family divalent metal transporter n=1 Tax=Sphingomonas trueperi TaxID=53317 RepID=UPI00339798A1